MNILLELISRHLKNSFKDIQFNLELLHEQEETLVACKLKHKKTTLDLIYSPETKIAHCITHITKKSISDHSLLFKVIISLLKILSCKQLTFKLESEELLKTFETFISKDNLQFDIETKEAVFFFEINEQL
jgi:hypothetical protein